MDLQAVIDAVWFLAERHRFLFYLTELPMSGISARLHEVLFVAAPRPLIIPDKGIAALNEEALKSSAGALEKIHICRVNSLLKAVDSLHLNGILAFASAMQNEKKVYELPS